PALHRRDTLAAGAALCDAAAVQVLVEEGPARVRELQTAGAKFDLDPSGKLKLGREAAHSRRRIVHAHGDQTGAEVARTLIARVRESRNVTVLERARVLDLIVEDEDGEPTVIGARASVAGQATEIVADATVLATGGCGARRGGGWIRPPAAAARQGVPRRAQHRREKRRALLGAVPRHHGALPRARHRPRSRAHSGYAGRALHDGRHRHRSVRPVEP